MSREWATRSFKYAKDWQLVEDGDLATSAIGAHALALGLTLVTANEADCAGIPGLRIENWTLPL